MHHFMLPKSWTSLAACFVALLLTSQAPAVSGGPSFDCQKANFPDEKAICADPKLSAIDQLIANAYKKFEPTYGNKKGIARALVADRHACGADVVCIISAQANALQTYDAAAPDWVEALNEALIGRKAVEFAAEAPQGADQPMPAKIGDCAVTHIATLTTRFGNDLASSPSDEGSGVSFVNGGAQISYDRDAGLVASQVGDPVAVCLISIPRDCPAGDDRGRIYYGVDLKRHGTWTLPDSQHGCGGA